jgi:hypothetical protein
MEASTQILVMQYFAGMFLCNAIPHLAAGLQGRTFPSPFASPPTIGHSSALVNVFWGLFNVVAGLVLVEKAPITAGMNGGFIAAILGALSTGVFVALHFGKYAWRDAK